MVRTTYIDLFTEDEKMEVDVKLKFDVASGNYPILAIKTESKTIRFYPTMDQIKQLQQALNEFVGEYSQCKQYLHCFESKEYFTSGKDYYVIQEDTNNGIYTIRDDAGDLRYIELSKWTDQFEWIEK